MGIKLHGIDFPAKRIEEICRAFGVGRLSVFGSILRDDFSDLSDIDLLVEFKPGTKASYLTMVRLAAELSAVLGRTVDLRTPAELHSAFRAQVMKEAVVGYVAA